MPPFNLMAMLGKIPRSNKKFAGYEENPEYFDEMGKQGIKFRQSPDFLSKSRPVTLGNTVFVPPGGPGYFQEQADYVGGEQGIDPSVIMDTPYSYKAGEEIPHVAQYRQKGLMGFLGQYLGQTVKSLGQRGLYSDKESLEGFHYEDPEEKKRLQNIALRR